MSKLATVVKDNPKLPFSIATTQRSKEGRNSFSLDCSTFPLIRTL